MYISNVKVTLRRIPALQAGLALRRRGDITLRDALRYDGPHFYPNREDGERLGIVFHQAYVQIIVYTETGAPDVSYSYPNDRVSRVRTEYELASE